MAAEKMRVAATQLQHRAGDKSYNLGRVVALSEAGAGEGVELINFPECCLSGYWQLRHLNRDEMDSLAEEVPTGPMCQSIFQLASKLNMTIAVGLLEKDQTGRFYNTQFVAMPDGNWARHRKLHVFVSKYLTPGDSFTVFKLPNDRRAGVLICYDNNIVENARITALQGAELLLAPHQTGGCMSGSPFAMGRIDVRLWENRQERPDLLEAEFRGDKGRGWLMRWLPARAHDNGLFLIFSNGVGQDDDEVRTGNAMVLDCYGRLLGETCSFEDQLVIADLDFSLRERCTGVRWMRARRPALYGELTADHGEQETREVRFDFLKNP